ncbi:sensory box histidine kinase PhoR [Sporichthya brevicatena]|uniref:histidine kinase n=1 Tax=Sporichthya brevicatena TaxID=171442 RepID=A0ABN1GGZ2_9ACTN
MSPRARLRGLSAQVPLRVKLMAALLVLTTAAVGITGATATAVLRDYLVDRLDNRLELYTNTAMPYMSQPVPAPATSALTLPRLPNPYFLITWDAEGNELRRENAQFEAPGAAPRLKPVRLAEAEAKAGAPFDVEALGGNQPDWRALLTPLPDGTGSLMVAVSLNEVDITVSRLTRILIAVGLSVLTLVAVLAYAIVRSSLRPLREVETTALAIAAGDLSRRVPDHPHRTEVGQLSAAVNGMLTQIESAVRERESAAAEARTSEKRMRQFVTDASHELRTPLTSIRGFAELYRQGAAGPEQMPSLLRRIEDEATRMGLLVEDLLLLARLDQQRPLRQEPVDLVTVATDAVHAARAADPDRPIEVGMLNGDEPPGVIGDEGRLRQIADNLVSNACTHTPPGTPVRVGVGAEVIDGRHWAVLEVADSGPGLSEEERDRVFERFYRTDSSRARSTGGTGLGLSIVAALVAAHGGDVTVDSAPGRGATFRVRIPALS